MSSSPVTLMYHDVDEDGGMYSVTPEQFSEHLSLLRRTGLPVVQGSRLAAATGRAAAVTFDDGAKSVVTEALPRLAEVGLTATLFMTAAAVGDEGWCSAGDLQDWCAAGNELGTHGWAHYSLTAVPQSQALEELARSKAVLEDFTGAEVASVSFPYGRLNRSLVSGAHDLGLTVAFGSWPGYGAGRSGAFGRFAVFRRTSGRTISRVLAGRGALPYAPQRGLFVLGRTLGDGAYMRLRRWLRRRLQS